MKKTTVGVLVCLSAIAITASIWSWSPRGSLVDGATGTPTDSSKDDSPNIKGVSSTSTKQDRVVLPQGSVATADKPPIERARRIVLPVVRSVSLSSVSALERVGRQPGDTELTYLKRLINAEWRNEKNRLIYKLIANGEFELIAIGGDQRSLKKPKGIIQVSVDTVQIDGKKWNVRVFLDSSKHDYFKNLTDYMLNLNDQVQAELAREFNALPLTERKEIESNLLQLARMRTTWGKTDPGPDKDALAENFMSAKRAINPKWQYLTIKKGRASPRTHVD